MYKRPRPEGSSALGCMKSQPSSHKTNGRVDTGVKTHECDDSDLKFISAEENVDFDEALFDDMDGLDIDDEDLE